MKTCVDCGKAISYKATRCRSCAMRLRWARGDYTPELQRRMQKAAASHRKEQWTDERRRRQSEAIGDAHAGGAYDNAYGEEHRRKVSEGVKAAHARGVYGEESRKRLSDRSRGAGNPNWQGGKIARTCEICGNTFEVFPKTIRQGKGRFCSRECANKSQTGSGSPGWRGGISFEPYSPEFSEAFKRMIRERDNFHCAICRLPGDHVHHIDYCKENTVPDNCITLCRSCHAKIGSSNRKYWSSVLQDIMAKRQACAYMRTQPLAGAIFYRYERAGDQAAFGLDNRPVILGAIKEEV